MGNDKEKVDEVKGPGKLDTGKIVVTVKKDMGVGRQDQLIPNAFVELIASNVHKVDITNIDGVVTFDNPLQDNTLFLVRVTALVVSNTPGYATGNFLYAYGNNIEIKF